MYHKPVVMPLDATSENALCCHISVDDVAVVRTPLCPFPTCRIFEPCTVTVGPVTVSGT